MKDDKYKGLNDFRMNFGSCAIEYAGDFELVTNNTLYFMYKKIWYEKKRFFILYYLL